MAQDIVENMKDIINQDINYFNSDSIIIASTDKTRIGSFHGGAKKVFEQKRDLIIRYDDEFKGAKQGINLPVYFENEIVGVIGITGKQEEVEKYGRIIQRMTEILIKEGYIQEQKKKESESRRQYVEELLFRYDCDEVSLLARAEILNIKLKTNRIAVVARIMERNNEFKLTPTINEEIFGHFKKMIWDNPQNLITQRGMNIIIVYELKERDNIENKITRLKDYLENKYAITVYLGIGEPYDKIEDINKSYNEAKKALDINCAFRNKEIMYYRDLDIGLLIDDIPVSTSDKYTQKIFNGMNRTEIIEYSIVIDAYLRHNGSITKAANELFIHKNTLQYRLNRLKELTGYDPRTIKDMVVLYLAFTLFRLAPENNICYP